MGDIDALTNDVKRSYFFMVSVPSSQFEEALIRQ